MVRIGSSLILLPLLLLSPLLLRLSSSLLVAPKILLSAMVVKTKEITAFQQKVYKACSAIPKGLCSFRCSLNIFPSIWQLYSAGKVCTYKELAKKIGSPKAVRAVGSALKNNPFAPKVPCHRVVASDRSLGRWIV